MMNKSIYFSFSLLLLVPHYANAMFAAHALVRRAIATSAVRSHRFNVSNSSLRVGRRMISSGKLPNQAYQKVANQVLDATLKLKQGLPKDVLVFCKDRMEDLEKFQTNSLDVKRALKMLNSFTLFIYSINHFDSNSSARFVFEFASGSEELLTYRVRKELNCYILVHDKKIIYNTRLF